MYVEALGCLLPQLSLALTSQLHSLASLLIVSVTPAPQGWDFTQPPHLQAFMCTCGDLTSGLHAV